MRTRAGAWSAEHCQTPARHEASLSFCGRCLCAVLRKDCTGSLWTTSLFSQVFIQLPTPVSIQLPANHTYTHRVQFISFFLPNLRLYHHLPQHTNHSSCTSTEHLHHRAFFGLMRVCDGSLLRNIEVSGDIFARLRTLRN